MMPTASDACYVAPLAAPRRSAARMRVGPRAGPSAWSYRARPALPQRGARGHYGVQHGTQALSSCMRQSRPCFVRRDAAVPCAAAFCNPRKPMTQQNKAAAGRRPKAGDAEPGQAGAAGRLHERQHPAADHQPGPADPGRPELAQGGRARADAARGLHPAREDHALRPRAHSRARGACARLGGARLLPGLQVDGAVHARPSSCRIRR